ncbi:MAG: response regulator [Elusimicrobiota bacterium]
MAKKILIVDDEPDLLTLVSYGLDKKGCKVFCSRDGREALAMTAQHMPDLVILDVNLPVINGDEVAWMLKKDEKLKHIPVILISSVAESLSEKAEASGADAYLTKPFELEELTGLVKKLFERA